VGSLVKWIGHDAMIQPGNSGGPLVSMDGEIVGINEIGVGTMSGAIPSEIASVVAQDLIAHGKVRRTWIGVDFQPLLRGDASLPSPNAQGVLVGGVIPGSPAEMAGVHAGDLVLALDGQPVQVRFREEMPGFNRLLLSKAPGKDLALKIQRDGKDLDIVVKTDLRDDAEGKEIESKDWGLTAREIVTMMAKELQRPDKKGIYVGSARTGGPCEKAQPPIGAGDIITAAGDKPIVDLDSFVKVTAEITAGHSEPVPTLVTFERGSDRFLTLVEIGVRKPQDPTRDARHPWLAVDTQVLSRKLAGSLGLKGKKGVRITQVFPDSNASEAGFQVGDIVTHIDGNAIEASEPHDAEVFAEMIRGYKLDSKAVFTVFRGTEKVEITASLTAAPTPEHEFKEFDDAFLEFKARDVSYFDRVRNKWTKDQGGAFVTYVESGGWASVGGLGKGDLVLAVDGHPVAQVSDLETLVKAAQEKHASHVAFLVKRGIHTHFLEIEPKWVHNDKGDSK
jgi:serine protease Do